MLQVLSTFVPWVSVVGVKDILPAHVWPCWETVFSKLDFTVLSVTLAPCNAKPQLHVSTLDPAVDVVFKVGFEKVLLSPAADSFKT